MVWKTGVDTPTQLHYIARHEASVLKNANKAKECNLWEVDSEKQEGSIAL